MPIKICPHCNTRFVVDFDTTDYVHECDSGKEILDTEDVLVTGNWEDFSGSGTNPPQSVNLQGISNELFGTKADIEGYNEDEHTAHGNNKKLFRQRQYFNYINLKEEGLD